MRCGGNCLPAGAGVLTWRRRRARRAPARQGAAARRPGVGAVPVNPPLGSGNGFRRQLTSSLDALALPRPNSAAAGRLGAPKACP